MTTKHLTGAALLLCVAACSKPAAPAALMDSVAAAASAMAVNPTTAVAAAVVAKAIDAMPDKADSILTANHYTADTFERFLYDVAADSASAAAYAAAMK